jgi:hypothetical protein
MAQAPMGWPESLPPAQTIDPPDLEQMLENNPPEPMQHPEQFFRGFVVATLLTAALIGIVIWIIKPRAKESPAGAERES